MSSRLHPGPNGAGPALPRVAAVAFAAGILGAGSATGAILTVNAGFGTGAAGWTLIGGATVVATGDPSDNPYGRLPDGAGVFLYQTVTTNAPVVRITFDFFTGLMSPVFPSP